MSHGTREPLASGSPMEAFREPDCIFFGDNLDVLATLPSASIALVYLDPPFNTGRPQSHTRMKTVSDPEGGDRRGFGGRRFRTVPLSTHAYEDQFEDYLDFLKPRLQEIKRVLHPDGSLFFHIDYREAHYCKVLLDTIFGRDRFLNEIIWAYDYGARSRSRWPTKHDTILWYAVDPDNYVFDFAAVDRIPYLAPKLVGKEKAARGKTPTDVWWHTIVPTNGRERTGYPTQKPLGILRRIVAVHSRPGDTVADFFAGSGTTGAAARELDRRFLLADNNPAALAVMARRFAGLPDIEWRGYDPQGSAIPAAATAVAARPAG